MFKDVYAYEPEYAQEDTLFIKTEEPQANVIPNANMNSSLESAKYIKQKKKKYKKRKGIAPLTANQTAIPVVNNYMLFALILSNKE